MHLSNRPRHGAHVSRTDFSIPFFPEVYIPKKSASKSRQPRRRQRHPPSTSTPGAPREIPAEAVHQYAEIMEGLDTSWEEEDEKKEQGMGTDPQDQENGVFPDHSLLQYIDQLCGGEEFVCKVRASNGGPTGRKTWYMVSVRTLHPSVNWFNSRHSS